MQVVHLTASTFFGGPERQMLGLAQHLDCASSFVSYPEGGRCEAFLEEVRKAGFSAMSLVNDTPHMARTLSELTEFLRQVKASVLMCHTFKPNVLGRMAAKRVGIPCVVVSRGWTAENWKVRAYETVDRVNLRFVDHVVAVSDGQAAKVRKAGVPISRLSVIHNAARLNAFATPQPEAKAKLFAQFPVNSGVKRVIVAAGRLSPEKGYAVLVEAAAEVFRQQPDVGIVLYGEGGERPALEARINTLGLNDRFRMPGFTKELDALLPWATMFVIPSYTEGLPNVGLEASAAGVPVVATAVGGNPEVISDGINGLLVPSGDPTALSTAMNRVLTDEPLRATLAAGGVCRMKERFTFEAQAAKYRTLLTNLIHARATQRAA
jgi:glycosyltransferase involved in cell wall biosynthesis